MNNMIEFICLLMFLNVENVTAQEQITVKNKLDRPVKDYILEIPVEQLHLPFGNYHAVINGERVPVEISLGLCGKQTAILPVSNIPARSELTITVEQGQAENYPKRTHAELSHKIGGQFEGNKYVGGFSWVGVNRITLPGAFHDHACYLKYEGPGWESDKTGFRFYLDNRNAIDVFGKRVKDIVLPCVGIDGYDSYHEPADWGMDNLKVAASLGLGSIGIWNGEKVLRVEKRDSTTCTIVADGKIRSQIKTDYYGWDVNGVKCNLVSLISIDAGSRASCMKLITDKPVDNIATGIVKIKGVERITGKQGEWSYIATFGKQSLNNDMQGLAVFVPTRMLNEITEDALNHVLVLKPENNYVEYCFMPTWELDNEPVKTQAQFMQCIEEVLDRLNNNIEVNLK
ncbi:MAG: DUF4861 domain-containing protein [Tannerella sp.]|jgi:hypothetical protein|nr:DUF4861 domain-containing protein [Tannerella sp.]